MTRVVATITVLFATKAIKLAFFEATRVECRLGAALFDCTIGEFTETIELAILKGAFVYTSVISDESSIAVQLVIFKGTGIGSVFFDFKDTLASKFTFLEVTSVRESADDSVATLSMEATILCPVTFILGKLLDLLL